MYTMVDIHIASYVQTDFEVFCHSFLGLKHSCWKQRPPICSAVCIL